MKKLIPEEPFSASSINVPVFSSIIYFALFVNNFDIVTSNPSMIGYASGCITFTFKLIYAKFFRRSTLPNFPKISSLNTFYSTRIVTSSSSTY